MVWWLEGSRQVCNATEEENDVIVHVYEKNNETLALFD